MDIRDFENSPSGKCTRSTIGGWAFVPNSLPPDIIYDAKLAKLQSEANHLLGELSGTGRLLENPYLLISPYIRKEAVSSSRIEGTQSDLSDLFVHEASDKKSAKIGDVQEVENYVRAMEHGLKLVDTIPISLRLIKELHEVLMEGVRGKTSAPGLIRETQNWIGPAGSTLEDAKYVPPPPVEMREALYEWEKYLHENPAESPLIQCALMHYQFEAIHPFLDGNGRIGRLLIVLYLCEKNYLSQPLLYLSTFFEKYKVEYYDRLLAVSQVGDWRGWVEFFLRGIIEQSKEAIDDACLILELYKRYKQLLEQSRRISKSSYKLIDEIFSNPLISISGISKRWEKSYGYVKNGVFKLVEIGILSEFTISKRSKLYIAKELMELLLGKKK